MTSWRVSTETFRPWASRRSFQAGRAVWSTPLRVSVESVLGDMDTSVRSGAEGLAQPAGEQATGVRAAGLFAGREGPAMVVAAHPVVLLADRWNRFDDPLHV